MTAVLPLRAEFRLDTPTTLIVFKQDRNVLLQLQQISRKQLSPTHQFREFTKNVLENNPPLKIGNLSLDPPLVMAPMAGVSHSPLRQLVASFGRPGLFFSEMLSARRLPHENLTESLSLKRTEVEHPMAYQFFAPDTDLAAKGCKKLLEGDAEIIDFNLACPAPSIAGKAKSGAHLLSDLHTTEKILATMRSLILDRPFTVKIRLGKKPDLVFLSELTAMIEGCRVDGITLHPRLIDEKLKRRARWDFIGHIKTMTKLPVIGNGDVANCDDCRQMFQQTGCDAVMIGRAIAQKPWLFAEICGKPISISPEFLLETYCRAYDLITEFFPEEKALGRIKEFTWYYCKNLRFGHRFAARMQSLNSVMECRQMTKDNFKQAV